MLRLMLKHLLLSAYLAWACLTFARGIAEEIVAREFSITVTLELLQMVLGPVILAMVRKIMLVILERLHGVPHR